MPSNRIGRINEEIQRGAGGPAPPSEGPPCLPGGMVSITRVDTTSDLRYARVYISVLDKDQEKDVLKGLKSAGGFPAAGAGTGPAAAITPELQFIADDSIQHGAHILEILRQVERQDEARDDPDAGETEE